MTLEAQPNPQRPEGISTQQQERFVQLQADILGRLKPDQLTIVVSDDSEDPVTGCYLFLRKDGRWGVNIGSTSYPVGLYSPYYFYLNEPGESVNLVELLEKYALLKNYRELKKIEFGPQFNLRKYTDKVKEGQIIQRSVNDNLGLSVDSFLIHMEDALNQLSKEEK